MYANKLWNFGFDCPKLIFGGGRNYERVSQKIKHTRQRINTIQILWIEKK